MRFPVFLASIIAIRAIGIILLIVGLTLIIAGLISEFDANEGLFDAVYRAANYMYGFSALISGTFFVFVSGVGYVLISIDNHLAANNSLLRKSTPKTPDKPKPQKPAEEAPYNAPDYLDRFKR